MWNKLEEERRSFGKEPFAQGLRENHHDVASMIQFAAEQGMLARPLAVNELFTENTRGTGAHELLPARRATPRATPALRF